MGLELIYEDKLSQQVLLKFLRAGTIPSVEEVGKAVESIKAGRQLDKPLFNHVPSLVEKNEKASASKQNRTTDEIRRDLEVLYLAIYEAARGSSDIFDRTTVELQGLLSRAKDLEARLTSLLLLKRDTVGYFNFVYDTFENLSKVDQSLTTALIDLRSNMVQASPRRRDANDIQNEQGEILVSLDQRSVSARSVRGEGAEIIKEEIVDGSPLENIWTSSDRVALYKVLTKNPKPVTIYWNLDIGLQKNRERDPREFVKKLTKVVIDPHITNESGPIITTLQYLTNEWNWRNVPSTEFHKEISAKASWTFDKISTTALRIVMTKMRPDSVSDGVYQYLFGIRNISLFDQEFEKSSPEFTDTQLVTIALSAVDRNGARQEFNKVSLEVCESVPQDTDLEYSVDFGVSGTFSNTWSPIDPMTRENPKNPTVVLLDRVTTSTTNNIAILTGATGPGSQNFRYYDKNINRVLNTVLVSTDIPEDWEVWRNTARLSDNFSLLETNGEIVESGWRFDGTYYSCYVYISEEFGRVIDFGPSEIFINDRSTSGIVSLSRGIHKIRTRRKNWVTLNGLYNIISFNRNTGVFTGDRQTYGANGQSAAADVIVLNTTQLDPLYPYNHKLLVEGLNYNAGFPIHERIYIGATRVAAELMKYISLHDFASNLDDKDLTRWAQATIINDGPPATSSIRPIMKVANTSDIDTTSGRERFTIVRKFKSGTLATEIRLRAIFKTNNPNLTPTLDEYRIKLGR